MARLQAEKRAEAAAWSARTLAEAAAADRAIEELRPQLRMQLARLAVRAFTPMRCIGKAMRAACVRTSALWPGYGAPSPARMVGRTHRIARGVAVRGALVGRERTWAL